MNWLRIKAAEQILPNLLIFKEAIASTKNQNQKLNQINGLSAIKHEQMLQLKTCYKESKQQFYGIILILQLTF